ncbi:hypothetical protein CP985_05380 [Malaciobacter mytili LMG 24559]|uniref:FecR protein domain-containing protein n=1 Tax=Malaciobacter mytili LMG 24559 TaxID=1032238 RepID=A0AAX2AG79_9BACT|nr:hypothetical protein CP985_05380 [Malaciobacter mytili LMG 24559]
MTTGSFSLKIIFLSLFLLFNIFAKEVGKVEKVIVDEEEKLVALVQRDNEVLNLKDVGFVVHQNDIIKTYKKSKLKIRFLDDTIIYIGPKTTLEIAKYYYDKENKENNATNLKILNGSFRLKTGKIGELAPEQFKIDTKFSVIGIRG